MEVKDLINDISVSTARDAYNGVSFSPEKRAESTRNAYAATLASDYNEFAEAAAKGKTEHLLEEEFARYRQGYRHRYHRFLNSNARCVSWFIAGPSNFPVAKMNKRSDIAHRRSTELLDFRARAKAAIKRKLRPDLAPIYASDNDALEKLEAKIVTAEAEQERMKLVNLTIRKNAKAGVTAQIVALMHLGYPTAVAKELLKPDFCQRVGFPGFELTNNNARIRAMKARVTQITRLKSTPASEEGGPNAKLEIAPSDNRVRLWFAGKPSESVRADLKSHGFHWTPSLGCWQTYINYNSTLNARRIAGLPAA